MFLHRPCGNGQQPQIVTALPASGSHFPAFSRRIDTGTNPGISPTWTDFSTITTALVGRSVRRRPDDSLGCNVGPGPGPVLDDELLAEPFRQPLAHQAHGDVARTTG